MTTQKLSGSMCGYYRASFGKYAAYGLSEKEAVGLLNELLRRK